MPEVQTSSSIHTHRKQPPLHRVLLLFAGQRLSLSKHDLSAASTATVVLLDQTLMLHHVVDPVCAS